LFWRDLDRVNVAAGSGVDVASGFSRTNPNQPENLVRNRHLFGSPVLRRKPSQRSRDDALDVPGEGDVGFGGIQSVRLDPGAVLVELEQPRLQAGGDEALVEPEGEFVILVGHVRGARLLERDPGCYRYSPIAGRSWCDVGRCISLRPRPST